MASKVGSTGRQDQDALLLRSSRYKVLIPSGSSIVSTLAALHETTIMFCRARKRKRNTGGGMGSLLSEEMQQFLGVERMARTQVVKAIWAYIKENDLQVRISY